MTTARKVAVTFTLDADVHRATVARADSLRLSASALVNYILARSEGMVQVDLPAPPVQLGKERDEDAAN